jgi:hypothetical protein
VFGLFYLAWLAFTLVIAIFIVRNLVRVVRLPGERAAASGWLLVLITVFTLETWPFLLGRPVYYLECQYLSGLKVQQTVDLRSDGYLIVPKAYNAPDRMDAARVYDLQALQDLITGRISYFEKPIRTLQSGNGLENSPTHEEFGLGESGDSRCADARWVEPMLFGLRLPEGKCLTRTESRKSRARYRLQIGADKSWIELIDSVTDKRYASFRSFTHWSGWMADAGSLTYQCPLRGESFDHVAQRALTAFVLPDREGRVVTTAQLQSWRNSYARLRFSFAELPPRQATGQPTRESDRTCHLEGLPPDNRLEKVTAYSFGKTVLARLDASRNTVGQKEIVVNLPGQSVVLWLQSYDPAVWHILRTPGSKVRAIVVAGHHGQAVLGVERSIPVFIRSEVYSPGSNCVTSELSEVLRRVMSTAVSTNAYKGDGTSVLVLGEQEFNPSILIYSRERALNEFTIKLPAVTPSKRDPMTPLAYSPNPLPE